MIRLILILLVITALSLGIAWMADEPGRVAIDWSNYHIETSLMVLVAAVAVAALWCMLVYYVIYAVFRSPRSWLRSRLAKRQALGLEALTGAFAAIATQDIRAARKQIRRAQQYLPHQPLTLMLASQVARLEGNESQSRLYLEQMLKSGSTEFMAMRGLIESARRSQDDDTAILHAEKALEIKPSDHWLILTLAGLYIRRRRTQDALKLLDAGVRRRAVTRRQQRSLIAAALYEYAKPLVAEARWDTALPALQDALRCDAGFVPASALLAEAYAGKGDIPRALKVLSASWKNAPHPLLTRAMLRCFEPEKTRRKVIRIAAKLAGQHREHRESHYLLAAIALRSGDIDTARGEAGWLVEDRETVRACGTMAEIENAAGNADEAARWLERARHAPADAAYRCDECRHSSDQWEIICPSCGSVGSLH